MNPTHERAGLIGEVMDDARDLAGAEVDKLRAEARVVGESAKVIGTGLGVMMIAAVLLGQALAFGLVALGVVAWAAFTIVGLVAAITGVVFLKYPRTIANLASEAS